MAKIRRARDGVAPIFEHAMPPKLNWAVMWFVQHKGEWTLIEHWHDDDFISAQEEYDKLKQAQREGERRRRLITLRCANYAFPPPERLRAYEERQWTGRYKTVTKQVKVKGKKKPVKKKFKKKIFKWVEIDPMRPHNEIGILWCPYCRELRRFQHQAGFEFEGIYVPQEAWYCPVCGITAHHRQVQKYNPLGHKYGEIRRTRSSGRGSKRRGSGRGRK
jgi:hypothetical protein